MSMTAAEVEKHIRRYLTSRINITPSLSTKAFARGTYAFYLYVKNPKAVQYNELWHNACLIINDKGIAYELSKSKENFWPIRTPIPQYSHDDLPVCLAQIETFLISGTPLTPETHKKTNVSEKSSRFHIELRDTQKAMELGTLK